MSTYAHIKSKWHNPKWLFRHHDARSTRKPKQGEMYFGWELEFEASDECSESLESIAKEIKKRHKWAWVKHDSSLRNGFEIISHPATRYWHIGNQENLNELIDFLNSKGMFVASSFGTGEGGSVHIHINRSWFDNDEQIRSYENYVLDATKSSLFDVSHSLYCKLERNEHLFDGVRYYAVTIKNPGNPASGTVAVNCFRDNQQIDTIILALSLYAHFAKENK